MASMLVKYGAKKVLKGKSSKSGDKNTESFHYTDHKGKRRRKDIAYFVSCGIPEEDARILAKIKDRAMLMDGGGKIAGIPIPVGIGGAIGFIPVVGDAVDGALAYLLIVRSARKVSGGLDSMAHEKMIANVTLDLVIGFVPVLGDFADMLFRANTKNADLLEQMLRKRVEALKNGEPAPKNRRNNRQNGVILDETNGLESESVRSESPQSSIRRQHAPAEPARSKTQGWASGFGGNGSQKHNAPSGNIAPQRPSRSDTNGVAQGQGYRFADHRDLLR